MAEGIFVPDFTLSQFTKKAVKEAGIGGDKAAAAREHLNKSQTLGAVSYTHLTLPTTPYV